MTDISRPQNVNKAILRGAACRCPKCGKGRIFDGYLTLKTACPACREDFSNLRTADGPAFFTMSLVGLLLIPALWLGFTLIANPLALAVTVSGGITLLTLILLRPIKGGWLGFEWAYRR